MWIPNPPQGAITRIVAATLVVCGLGMVARTTSVQAQPAAPAATAAAAVPTATAATAATAAPAVSTAKMAALGDAARRTVDTNTDIKAVPEADRLRSPDAAAFAILDVAPTEIQKPTTPRDLAVALSTFVGDDTNLRIPDNVAIQVAPYWLLAHERLEYADYATDGPRQLWRNLTLSMGTTGSEGSTARNLGAGVATHYALDEPKLERCTQLDRDLIQLAGATSLGLSADEMNELRSRYSTPEEFDNAMRVRKAQRVAEVAELQAHREEVLTNCAEAATARRHVLSAAAALAWRFPGTAAEDGDLISQAYWLTYAYSRGSLSLLGVGRLRFDEAKVGWDGFADAGMRTVFAKDAFAASVEVIGRKQIHGEAASGSNLQLRVALLAEYMLKDGDWLTITFGKEFAAADAGALFSLANLTTTFGKPKVSR